MMGSSHQEECTSHKGCFGRSMSIKWLMLVPFSYSGSLTISQCSMANMTETCRKLEQLESISSKCGRQQAWRCRTWSSCGLLRKSIGGLMNIGCRWWTSHARTQLQGYRNAPPSWVENNPNSLKCHNSSIPVCSAPMCSSWTLMSASLVSIKGKWTC